MDLFAALETSRPLPKVKEALAVEGVNVNEVRRVAGVESTPLLIAAGKGLTSVVKLLLKHPDINVNLPHEANRQWSSPLHRASMKGYPDVVELLLSNPNINVNAYVEAGGRSSAIEVAARDNRARVVELLWPLADQEGRESCINIALTQNKYEVIAKVIELGGHIDISRIELCFEEITCFFPLNALVRVLLQDLPIAIENFKIVPRMDHYNLWTKFLVANVRTDDSVSKVEVVRNLLANDMFQGVDRISLYRHLVYAQDRYNRVAYDTTDAIMKDYLRRLFYFLNRYEISEGPPVHKSATSVVLQAIDHGICSQVFEENALDKRFLDIDGFTRCNQTLGRLSSDSSTIQKPLKDSDADCLRNEFYRIVGDSPDKLMKEEEYKKFCDWHFGQRLKVVLKFMLNESEHRRERETRNQLESSFILQLLPAESDERFAANLSDLGISGGYRATSEAFKYVLVMPAADRSLEDIYLKERASANHIAAMLYEVVAGLLTLHGNGYVHGDLKKLNIVRIGHKLKLIDFDAATPFGHPIGVKFSSGILPPEMFYKLANELEEEAHGAYWKQSGDVNDDLWAKVKPCNGYVVRAYRPEYGTDGLPYDLVKADPALDSWAIGCLMLQMWTGVELVSTDINQDVVPDRIEQAALWTDAKLSWRIKSHHLESEAEDLLLKLLVVDPSKRLTMADILRHRYFKRPLPIKSGSQELL